MQKIEKQRTGWRNLACGQASETEQSKERRRGSSAWYKKKSRKKRRVEPRQRLGPEEKGSVRGGLICGQETTDKIKHSEKARGNAGESNKLEGEGSDGN